MGHSWAYLIKITDVLPVLLCITLSSTHYRLSEHDMTYGFGVWAMGWVLINPGRVGETDISCFTPHVGQAERPTKGWSGEPLWIPAASLLQQWWPELHTYCWDTDAGMTAWHSQPMGSSYGLVTSGNQLIQGQLHYLDWKGRALFQIIIIQTAIKLKTQVNKLYNLIKYIVFVFQFLTEFK